MTEMLRVIAYDIESNRARARAADVIEAVAARVQYSVYEARLTQAQVDRLLKELRTILGPGDKLRIYAVPDRALQGCRSIGGGDIAAGARYWMF